MSLVCVLGSFRASVCAFRVSELLVVRLSFVVKCFRLRCVSCEIPKFSCRVLNSSFSFEIVVEIFDSSFEFKFLEFFVSILEFVFFVLSLYSISRISIRICRRNFRWLALFDFSNFDSNLSSKFSFRCSIRFLEFRLSIRLLDSSPLNFEFVVSSRISNSS